MKTIVVYASKHGSAKKIAEGIAKQLDCACVDCKEIKQTDATQVLAVCGIYAGMIAKPMKSFLSQLPKETRIGFLKVGVSMGDEQKVLSENFKDQPLDVAFASCAGGVLTMSKLGFFEKRIISMINKQGALFDKGSKADEHSFLDEQAISNFIESAKQ